MKASRNGKNFSGGATNPNGAANGVKGKTRATPTIAMLVANKSLLGLLLQKGDFLVLIANMTSVCVHKDSMNQAV